MNPVKLVNISGLRCALRSIRHMYIKPGGKYLPTSELRTSDEVSL